MENLGMTAQAKPARLAEKRIVVTGGAGFLGRAVVRKLGARGCRDVIVPRRAACDLTRPEEIERLLGSARPDFLVHLAATVDNPTGGANAAASFLNNVLMSTQLIDAAARRGIEKMVCLGSASSYPANAPMPLREDDLFNGLPDASRMAYGISKRLPFVQAQACRKQYGLRCVFLIPTNFYGPDDNFDPETCYVIPAFIRTFLEAAETRASDVTLRGTGCATRDFLHVEDCAEGIVLALERYDRPEPVNLGSGAEVGIDDLARRIASLAGYSGRILWNTHYSDGSVRRVLDTSRAEQGFGFRARRNLDEGLRETMDWYRSTRSGSAPRAHARTVASRV